MKRAGSGAQLSFLPARLLLLSGAVWTGAFRSAALNRQLQPHASYLVGLHGCHDVSSIPLSAGQRKAVDRPRYGYSGRLVAGAMKVRKIGFGSSPPKAMP